MTADYFAKLERQNAVADFDEFIDRLQFNRDGLIPVVAQRDADQRLLMLAWMNRDALRKTLETGQMTYYSRSRKKLWRKGETSGNTQQLQELRADCDGDALLAVVRQNGPACHTGRDSCFFFRIQNNQPVAILSHPSHLSHPSSHPSHSSHSSHPSSPAMSAIPEDEIRVRRDLAACHRLADHFGWSDIVWNHITARVPGDENHFLIMEMGMRYDEVTAGNLIKLNQDGDPVGRPARANKTGFVIHGGIYAARPEVNFIMHTHTRAGMAVSALKDGLIPLVNDVVPLHDNVAYHEFEGVSTDPGENARIVAALGKKPAMMLRNHGLLTAGESAGEAFMLMYYLDRACQVQMDALSSGREINPVRRDILESASERFRDFRYGKEEWPALLRLAEQRFPDFQAL